MKRKLLILFFLPLLGCSQDYKNLSPIEFKSSFEKNNGIILDVRTPEELKSGIIEGASTIDFYDDNFKKKISKIQKDKVVYVYCRSGGRSSKAARLLLESGQEDVINLNGGIMAWKNSGYPLLKMVNKIDENIQSFTETQFKEILYENNLVLVDFHTLWCVPCRKMSPVVDELEKKYINKIHISRVDIDKSEDLANKFKINSVPTFILFKDNREIWRKTGMMPKNDLVKILDKNL